jgi:hypothetical protein
MQSVGLPESVARLHELILDTLAVSVGEVSDDGGERRAA